MPELQIKSMKPQLQIECELTQQAEAYQGSHTGHVQHNAQGMPAALYDLMQQAFTCYSCVTLWPELQTVDELPGQTEICEIVLQWRPATHCSRHACSMA